MKLTFPLLVALALLVASQCVESELEVGFYEGKCKLAESIVKDEVKKAFLENDGIASGLVWMQFHDCFVKGCDGSVLIDSTPSNKAEKDSTANSPSLRGFRVIDRAKVRLEAVCEGVVSCADLLAFAARDIIEMTGGIGYPVPAVRRDGRVSFMSESLTNLPPPSSDLDQLTQIFATKVFTQEMVTLSGAHTIGRSHCASFSNRFYKFNSTVRHDPSLDPTYAAALQQHCPENSDDQTLVVPMNQGSPAILDVSYYHDVISNRGLFTSDHALLMSSVTAGQVIENSGNPDIWKKKFAAAMVKLGNIDVLTSDAGEIRKKIPRDQLKTVKNRCLGN